MLCKKIYVQLVKDLCRKARTAANWPGMMGQGSFFYFFFFIFFFFFGGMGDNATCKVARFSYRSIRRFNIPLRLPPEIWTFEVLVVPISIPVPKLVFKCQAYLLIKCPWPRDIRGKNYLCFPLLNYGTKQDFTPKTTYLPYDEAFEGPLFRDTRLKTWHCP